MAKPVMPKYPAFAAAFRRYLASEGLTVSDFGRRLGVSVSTPAAWLHGRGLPALNKREAVAQALGIEYGVLFPEETEVVVGRPAGPATSPRPPAVQGPADIMQLSFRADGTARIRLDVTLSHERAMPIVRLLMDAGLVVGGVDDGERGGR